MEEQSIQEKIENIIEKDIRPYIEADGGYIEFEDYSDGIVSVRLAGACAGCPGAAMTLKGGVERVLRSKLSEVQSVRLAL